MPGPVTSERLNIIAVILTCISDAQKTAQSAAKAALMGYSNQGDRQATVRASTGTAYDYQGDWMALFDSAGIAAGDFNGRLLAWINSQLSTSYTEVNGAMYAFAASQGAYSWNELGTFTIGGSIPATALAWGSDGLQWGAGNYMTWG